MKEKTADEIEKKLKAYLAVLNEENILYRKEDAIKGIIKNFSNLIAENKELKEMLRNHNIDIVRKQIENLYIPKSKVEETIQTMNTNILNAEKFDYDYIGQCRFAKYVLQSLLGKVGDKNV